MRSPSATDPAEVRARLREAGVRAVTLGFVDSAAIVRAKTVPLAGFEQAATAGVGLSTLFNVAMSNDQFASAPGYIDGPSGDIRLRADAAATVPLAAAPGWAWAPVDQVTQGGEPFPPCPRTFARRMTEAVEARGMAVRAAFEFECSVGIRRDDGGWHPSHQGPGYSDIALVANHDFALDLVDAIEAQGLGLQQFHPEYAEGQFELSIAPRDPVAAADAAMVVRQVVRIVARRHGLVVSFAPQVTLGTGNGVHLHLSLWEGTTNLHAGGDGAAGMRPAAEALTAGILDELPAIVAVTVPTELGYLRLQPRHWSGATRCWGVDNREAALRVVAGARPASVAGARPASEAGARPASEAGANVEVKPVDGTANPYLAVGSLLAAGLAGIERDLRLPPSTEEDPDGLPADVKAERGIEQLPASLSQAAERLADSAVLRAAMGDFLFETFLATRRGEVTQYEGLDAEELIRRLRWRY